MPSIEDWDKFKALVEYRGVRAAAAALHLSPGAISTALRKMEEELNQGPLLARGDFSLTDAGRRWYEPVVYWSGMLQGLTHRARTERGFKFVLGGSPYVMEHYMPYVLQTIRSYGGEINFRLKQCRYAEIPDLLLQGKIDIAVGPLSPEVSPHIECIRLLLLAPVLLVPDLPAHARVRSIAQLFRQGTVTQRLITPPSDSMLTRLFDHYLRLHQVTWNNRDECDEVGWIPTLVENGQGLGLGFDLPSMSQRPRIRSLPLTGIAGLEYGLLWARARRENSANVRRAMEATASSSFRLARNGKVLAEHPSAPPFQCRA